MIGILVIIYIVFISLGLPDSLFGVTWPVVHKNFMIPESFASVYSIITGICAGGVSFIAGPLLRKFGTPKVTYFSILLTVIGLIGISFSPNIIVMMIFTVIMSYGSGAIDTGLNNYISLNYKARHMSWLHCFWGVGVTLSPLIMSNFLSGTGEWRNGYRIIALIQFSISLLVLISIKKWIKAENNNKKPTRETETNGNKKEKVNFFKIKGVITSILSQGLYCSMEFLIGTWGASYLVNTFGYLPDTAARWISLYFCGIMVGRLISGFISIKASDNTLIRAGISVAFIGMIILIIPLGAFSPFGLLLIGVGFGPIFPSILHSVPERFGKEYSTDLTGFHMGGAYGAGFFVQLVFGYIATATTFNITPFVLLALIICLIIANEHTIKVLKRGKI